jgi:DNA-directed RNA polymerase specialized sigma24 family protein
MQFNGSSFSQFVTAYDTAVYSYCYRMLGSAGAAEAAAETAFLDAYSLFPAVSLPQVLAAARCRCRRQLQQNGRLAKTAVDEMQSLYDQLPVSEREVMALRYGCRLGVAEIAAVLDASCDCVRQTLQQGRIRAVSLVQLSVAHPNRSNGVN